MAGQALSEIQPIEARIRETDGIIMRVAREYAEQVAAHQPLQALDARVAFLRTLFRRRDGLLDQYAKSGGSVKGLYTFEVRMGGTDDERGKENAYGNVPGMDGTDARGARAGGGAAALA